MMSVLRAARSLLTIDPSDVGDTIARRKLFAFRERVEARGASLECIGRPHDTDAAIASLVDLKAITDAVTRDPSFDAVLAILDSEEPLARVEHQGAPDVRPSIR